MDKLNRFSLTKEQVEANIRASNISYVLNTFVRNFGGLMNSTLQKILFVRLDMFNSVLLVELIDVAKAMAQLAGLVFFYYKAASVRDTN